MFRFQALLCFCTAYLVSSGPVGIRLCHILCDRDCSCSVPIYDSEQTSCVFNVSTAVTPHRTMCTSRTCRVLSTKHGSVRCVDNNLRDGQKESSPSQMFVLPNVIDGELQLSRKGINLNDVHHVTVEVTTFTQLTFLVLTGPIIVKATHDASHKTFKVVIYNFVRTFAQKEEHVAIPGVCYIHFALYEDMVSINLSQPEKHSPPCFTESARPRMTFTDLAISGKGRNMKVEICFRQ